VGVGEQGTKENVWTLLRGETSWGGSKLHNKVPHKLYSSPNMVLKSRIVRYAEHLPCMVDMIKCIQIVSQTLRKGTITKLTSWSW
jgi:hypothetical protein